VDMRVGSASGALCGRVICPTYHFAPEARGAY
jgi:hypothetical protein